MPMFEDILSRVRAVEAYITAEPPTKIAAMSIFQTSGHVATITKGHPNERDFHLRQPSFPFSRLLPMAFHQQ